MRLPLPLRPRPHFSARQAERLAWLITQQTIRRLWIRHGSASGRDDGWSRDDTGGIRAGDDQGDALWLLSKVGLIRESVDARRRKREGEGSVTTAVAFMSYSVLCTLLSVPVEIPACSTCLGAIAAGPHGHIGGHQAEVGPLIRCVASHHWMQHAGSGAGVPGFLVGKGCTDTIR